MHTRFTAFLTTCILLLCLAVPGVSQASETNGTIIGAVNTGYAWSDNSGWINFAPSAGNIHVTDPTLTGYAWGTNSGWINLAPANGGVTNDSEGVLSGYAWGAGLGWINFSGVTIDSTGHFHGAASGSLVGTLTFDCANCDVRTDWRPHSARGGGSSASLGGNNGGGGAILAPGPGQTPTITPQPLLQAKEQDPVKDGVYNILDFNALMVNWGSEVCGNDADMNKDCVVDIIDFNTLMVLWDTKYQI